MICTHCGASADEDAKFCTMCGKELQKAAPIMSVAKEMGFSAPESQAEFLKQSSEKRRIALEAKCSPKYASDKKIKELIDIAGITIFVLGIIAIVIGAPFLIEDIAPEWGAESIATGIIIGAIGAAIYIRKD